jgi:hypothetical protein
MTWTIGVTTAPRRISTIKATLDSLQAAGWPEITVFAEPDSDMPEIEGVRYVERVEKYGAYKNWREALRECRDAGINSEYFALAQDDLVVRPELRQCMEEGSLVSERDTIAIVSPYCPGHNYLGGKGWGVIRADWGLCGACFYAFNTRTINFLDKTMPRRVHENKHIDGYVGKMVKATNCKFQTHRPSLVQHTANDNSTLGYGPHPRIRTANDYKDEPCPPAETS